MDPQILSEVMKVAGTQHSRLRVAQSWCGEHQQGRRATPISIAGWAGAQELTTATQSRRVSSPSDASHAVGGGLEDREPPTQHCMPCG